MAEISAGTPPSSYDVYRWPEFIAFMERLGFKYGEERTLGVVITIGPYPDSVVQIQHTFQALDKGPQIVEITNLNNEQFRTFRPPTKREVSR